MLNLKEWERFEYSIPKVVEVKDKDGHVVKDADGKDTFKAESGTPLFTFELKRLTRAEARPVVRAAKKVLIGDYAGRSERLEPYEDSGDLVNWFRDYVRNVKDLKVGDLTITGGEQLLENSDDAVVCFVLDRLLGQSLLKEQETKASASRSTSSAAAGTGGGASAATPTEREAGQTP
jgi:hypothetical protein